MLRDMMSAIVGVSLAVCLWSIIFPAPWLRRREHRRAGRSIINTQTYDRFLTDGRGKPVTFTYIPWAGAGPPAIPLLLLLALTSCAPLDGAPVTAIAIDLYGAGPLAIAVGCGLVAGFLAGCFYAWNWRRFEGGVG